LMVAVNEFESPMTDSGSFGVFLVAIVVPESSRGSAPHESSIGLGWRVLRHRPGAGALGRGGSPVVMQGVGCEPRARGWRGSPRQP
jgi:hypothetical protein